MNAQTIIKEALADGLVMTVTTANRLLVEGDSDKLERWKPVLAAHKLHVIAALSERTKQAIYALPVCGQNRSLERRIKIMAIRWRYSPDEAAEVLARAAIDPNQWLLAVNLDERKFGAGEEWPLQ